MQSDILLIKECQAGDISAFEKLVDMHKKQVYQIAYQFTWNHEDADDISQEVFMHAYKSIRKFRGDSQISTWLQRITINISINYMKKMSRSPHNEELFDEAALSSIPADIKDPLDNIESGELIHKIRAAIRSLPIKERVIFILRVYRDMSYKEIARFLSCPEGSVMSGLYNAREKLKNKLKDYIA